MKRNAMVRLPRVARCRLAISLVAVVALAAGCTNRELRGSSEPSDDGLTYLIVQDDNGGGCGPIRLDGRRWPHAIGARGAIAPGPHTIECGTQVEFRIEAGTTFRFDYWGP